MDKAASNKTLRGEVVARSEVYGNAALGKAHSILLFSGRTDPLSVLGSCPNSSDGAFGLCAQLDWIYRHNVQYFNPTIGRAIRLNSMFNDIVRFT